MIKSRFVLAFALFFGIIGLGNLAKAEEELYIPLAAEQAIELSQGQLTVSEIQYPDGSLGSSTGQGFLIEGGLIVSALHIYSPPEFNEEDKDILTKERTVMFQGVHADIVYASSFYDIAIYKLRRIPAGMKPVVFAKNTILFQQVFAKLKVFFTFDFKGEKYGYELNLPYRGVLVDAVRVYKNIEKAPEPTNLEFVYLDNAARTGFSGAMFVNSKGEVVGIGDMISGGYTILLSSSATIKKAIEEYKAGAFTSSQESKSENEQLNQDISSDKGPAINPNLLKAFEQADIFKEILGLYEARGLEKPKDLVKCAQEMLAMQANGECRDRFSHYFTPEEAKARDEASSLKEDSGIGIQLKEMEGKVIIIINRESASASEIFAGAMQDWGVAKIIGQISFGKGVGQTCFDLRDKSLFCLTTFEFLVGNHNVVIRDRGVIPDIELGQNEDALQKALEMIWND